MEAQKGKVAFSGCPAGQRQSSDLNACLFESFPGGADGKESACNAEDPGLIPGLGRSPGEGNDNPLQYTCLENSMGGGTRWITV